MTAIYWPDFPTFTDPLPFDGFDEGIPSSYRVQSYFVWENYTVSEKMEPINSVLGIALTNTTIQFAVFAWNATKVMRNQTNTTNVQRT